jgi:hypothetical protein
MISKEGFVALINSLIWQREYEKEFAGDMEKYFDGHFVPIITSELQKTIISVLEKEMDDKEIIEWWLYDAPEAGKNKENCWVDVGDIKFVVETPEQLYDFLNKN